MNQRVLEAVSFLLCAMPLCMNQVQRIHVYIALLPAGNVPYFCRLVMCTL